MRQVVLCPYCRWDWKRVIHHGRGKVWNRKFTAQFLHHWATPGFWSCKHFINAVLWNPIHFYMQSIPSFKIISCRLFSESGTSFRSKLVLCIHFYFQGSVTGIHVCALERKQGLCNKVPFVFSRTKTAACRPNNKNKLLPNYLLTHGGSGERKPGIFRGIKWLIVLAKECYKASTVAWSCIYYLSSQYWGAFRKEREKRLDEIMPDTECIV